MDGCPRISQKWGEPRGRFWVREGKRTPPLDGGKGPPPRPPPSLNAGPPLARRGARMEARRGKQRRGPTPHRGFEVGKPLVNFKPRKRRTPLWDLGEPLVLGKNEEENELFFIEGSFKPTPCAGIFQSLLYRRLQGLSTLFSEFFASFPYGTCALSISHRVFSLGRSIPPD